MHAARSGATQCQIGENESQGARPGLSHIPCPDLAPLLCGTTNVDVGKVRPCMYQWDTGRAWMGVGLAALTATTTFPSCCPPSQVCSTQAILPEHNQVLWAACTAGTDPAH